MIYSYKCTNEKCSKINEPVNVSKPMADAGNSEFCKECKEQMQKVYGSPAVRTGDGYKS